MEVVKESPMSKSLTKFSYVIDGSLSTEARRIAPDLFNRIPVRRKAIGSLSRLCIHKAGNFGMKNVVDIVRRPRMQGRP